jgi:hypothetical protein
MMKLAGPDDAAALVQRLRTVRPGTPARWGRMSAHQMICHLADAFRMARGERAVTPVSGFLQRTVLKWIALYAPLPWPAGIQTVPECDQQIAGTRPVEFARDVAEVVTMLDAMAVAERIASPPHPIFGPMSQRAWRRWAWLHTDHHLRQFGA